MNAKKQRELAIENGQLRIRNRVLEERILAAERDAATQKGYVAIVCLAFKNYIKSTSGANAAPLTESEVVAKLNNLIEKATIDANASFAKKETQSNDK